MKVVIIPNYEKNGTVSILEAVKTILSNQQIEFSVKDNLTELEGFDVILTIGGDGTIIHAAKIGAELDIPILGINAGRVGYLADFSFNELDLLSALKNATYTIEERMLLEVSVGSNKYFCLNEAVITKGSLSRMIDINVSVDNSQISYRADGLIAATPTGSTAYSMSAGGPVVDPALDLFILTPICSNSLFDRPIILNKDSIISVTANCPQNAEAYLTLDGEKSIKLSEGDCLTIKRADKTAKLIRIKNSSFYETLSEKKRG